MDACLSRCHVCYLHWQFGELHLRCAQGRTAALQWLLVSVLLVRCITTLQPLVSGIELLSERRPVRVVLQLFLLVQHQVSREHDICLLSDLTTNGRSDR